MEEKRNIESYVINNFINDKNKIIYDLKFNLKYKKTVKVLGRVLTINAIRVAYDSKKNKKPEVSLTTLKGESINNFELKKKYTKEIRDIIQNLLNKDKGGDLLQ